MAFFGALINPEYRQYLLQLPVVTLEAACYFLAQPIIGAPSVNFVGKRLREELISTAVRISQLEKWPPEETEPQGWVLSRVRRTINLASDIAPIKNEFDKRVAPAKRFISFPDTSQAGFLSNRFKGIYRKALYLGEAYWNYVLENRDTSVIEGGYAVAMQAEIKKRLNVLSSDSHISF